MSDLLQLQQTPEYKAVQELLDEKEKLSRETDGGLFFLGILGSIIKSSKKKARAKRIQEIDEELEQYSGFMRQLEDAQKEQKAREAQKLLDEFAASKYAKGYIIVYGKETRFQVDYKWSSFENAKLLYTRKFGAGNGYQFKDNYPPEELAATIFVDDGVAAQTDKETVFYKIPVSEDIHTISISGRGQLTVGGSCRFDGATTDGPLDITAGSKFVMFDLKIQPITDAGPRSLVTVTSYDDFALFAEDTGIRSVNDLEK